MLKKVVIPDYISELGDNVFSECSSLEEVVIPDKVAKIGKNTFDGCKKFTSIRLGRGIKA